MQSLERSDGHSYSAIRCSLCEGLTRVRAKIADEWIARNRPLGKR
jgi:hypothetical protein